MLEETVVWIRPEHVSSGRTQPVPELLQLFGFEKLDLMSWIINCHSITLVKQNIKQDCAYILNRNQKSFPQRKQNWKRHSVLNNMSYFVLSFCLPSVLIRSNWQLICSKHCTVKLISILRQKIRTSFWWKISSFRALHVAAVRKEKVWRY